MTLLEAINQRHSVRRYLDKPLDEKTVNALRAKIDELNEAGGLHIQLVTNERSAFSGMMSYGKFYGVENYIVMVGKKSSELDWRTGYYGEQLVLYAQTLGLNTCWVGLSYRKVDKVYKVADGEKLVCMIALGYGATQGVSHKTKTAEQVSNVSESTPDWFRKGVEAAVLAPTAINQQKFTFEYVAPEGNDKPCVIANKGFSLVGYTKIDLGIAMSHFEIAAGKNNFEWKY